MNAREDTRPFSYSGDDHNGRPLDMLEEARDGLWAAVHMVEACDVLDPTPMALKGLGNILRGLTETLESAQDILQERAGRCAKSPGAAEDERETDRLSAAFKEGAAKARQFPNAPIWDLWDRSDAARKHRAAESSRPDGEPEHVAAE